MPSACQEAVNLPVNLMLSTKKAIYTASGMAVLHMFDKDGGKDTKNRLLNVTTHGHSG